RVAVRNTAKQRAVELGSDVVTNDALSVVGDPSVDVVVELIGGIEPARELILTALQNGKAVVTGNKELLANVGAEGFEAAEKAGVIATVAFGVRVVAGDVYREGISGLPAADIAFAGRLGYVVKLLAITEADDGEVAVRVHPALVPTDHPLAAVRESYNAVFIEGAAVGDLMLYGRGAGGRPTASAVLGDVIDAASNRRRGTHAGVGLVGKARIRPIEDLSSQYYVALEVADKPGVLEAV